MRYALCVGINKFPNPKNNLRGCVNDAMAMRQFLRQKKNYDSVVILLDKHATVKRVRTYLKKFIGKLKFGDCFTFTLSSHGTSVKDKNRDERDGRDEALVLYNGLILDDELRRIFSKAPKGTRISMVADCCHSGTITRSFFMNEIATAKQQDDFWNYSVARYLPPKDDEDAQVISNLPLTRGHRMIPDEKMIEVLLTGCKATEYSYDAFMGGKFHGALTYTTLQILESKPNLTYAQFYKALRRKLPSSKYPQTPQLEGKKEFKNRPVFT